MDLSSLVRAVVGAFEDASKLVERIRDHRAKSEDTALPTEATKSLLESLALGPTIINGYYNHDFKRFGEPYGCGDLQVRDQMKDILINMQSTVISTLRIVFMDEQDLDFNTLQNASDDCRANAGVCLGMFSQRLSGAARAEGMIQPGGGYPYTPTTSIYGQYLSPHIGYPPSHSTHSSQSYGQQRPPDPIAEQIAKLTLQPATPPTRPGHQDRQTSLHSFASQESISQQSSSPPPLINGSYGLLPMVGIHQVTDIDGASLRRASSNTLAPDDNALLGISDARPSPNSASSPPQLNRDSTASSGTSISSPDMSRTSSNTNPIPPGSPSSNASGRRDVVPNGIQPLQKFLSNPEPIHSTNSFATRIQSYQPADEHVRFLQAHARPPAHMLRAHQERLQQMQQQYYNGQPGHLSYPPPLNPPPTNVLPPMPSQPPSSRTQSRPSSTTPSTPTLRSTNPEASGPIAVFHPTQSVPPQQHVQTGIIQSIPRLTQRGSVGPAPPAPTAIPPLVPTISVKAQIPPLRPRIPKPIDPPPQPTQMPPPTPVIRQPSPQTSPDPPPQSMPGDPPRSPDHTVAGQVAAPLPKGPANMPTEKALQGFCKGAFRLQIGLDKKAFIVAYRPVGVMNMSSHWKCDKCNYEGPLLNLVTNSAGGSKFRKSKAEPIFDPKVRHSASGGVHYRWAFLAKCHVEMKGLQVPEAARDGSFGSFGCIFCCAEGAQRGWSKDAAFVPRGGSQVNGRASNTPIFGNVESFMEHLEMHRTNKGCPNTDMVSRMRAVVGRTADENEDWDINLSPL